MRSDTYRDLGVTTLRVVAGFTFSLHGMQKLFGAFGGLGGHGGSAHAGTLMWVAGCLECFGGILILLGLLTRPVAFLDCGEMAFAYFTQHFPRSPWPLVNQGEPAVLYCFIFFFFVLYGPGPWSLDKVLRIERFGIR